MGMSTRAAEPGRVVQAGAGKSPEEGLVAWREDRARAGSGRPVLVGTVGSFSGACTCLSGGGDGRRCLWDSIRVWVSCWIAEGDRGYA